VGIDGHFEKSLAFIGYFYFLLYSLSVSQNFSFVLHFLWLFGCRNLLEAIFVREREQLELHVSDFVSIFSFLTLNRWNIACSTLLIAEGVVFSSPDAVRKENDILAGLLITVICVLLAISLTSFGKEHFQRMNCPGFSKKNKNPPAVHGQVHTHDNQLAIRPSPAAIDPDNEIENALRQLIQLRGGQTSLDEIIKEHQRHSSAQQAAHGL
jgi:hypothetical protein